MLGNRWFYVRLSDLLWVPKNLNQQSTFLMNSSQQLLAAEKALSPIFSGIDALVKQNLKKVLDSLRRHRVGVHHFAGVSGYGHDDLGRQTLDRVFAEVMSTLR